MTVDLPLYVLAKKIQWLWPETYGPDKYVVMMGGLHIEMSYLKAIGGWLSGSGWLNAIVKAKVISPGRGDSVQKGDNVTRSQWIHQVMLASLNVLQEDAYTSYIETTSDSPPRSKDEWVEASKQPQFLYWNQCMKMLKQLFRFLRAQRESVFSDYIESLEDILPWLFFLNHSHYARWLSIHVQDLRNLSLISPSTDAEFQKGAFVTQKSNRKFSAMAHDQVHQQLNAMIKGDGGFIGITENAETLKRWTVSATEKARLLNEMSKEDDTVREHHDCNFSAQTRFYTHVKDLVATIKSLGNPFKYNSSDLVTLDTKVIMNEESTKTVLSAEASGKAQYSMFKNNSMNDVKSFYEPLKKNNIQLFSDKRGVKKNKVKAKVRNIKLDVGLFSRMYIACQNREGDLDNFFSHENHAWPPALADDNEMRICKTKSELPEPLENLVENDDVGIPDVQCKLIDGAALVQSLDPKRANNKLHTFQDYAEELFIPNIRKQMRNTERVDVVWDIYRSNSLKAYTRESRGQGDVISVQASAPLPTDPWNTFLRDETNKSGLYHYLSETIGRTEVETGHILLSTFDEGVLEAHGSDETIDLSDLQPCNHEEADTRLILHAAHALEHGCSKVSIVATDTDVVVMACALASVYPYACIWVAFGHSTNFRYIPAHTIAHQLGPVVSWGLLFVHAFTGCDTVSAFAYVGKKKAFSTMMAVPNLHPVFKRLSESPNELLDDDIKELERFTVLLYNRTSNSMTVNDARKTMFGYQNKDLERIPPTKDALFQHILRAIYQGGHVWGNMLVKNPKLPSPADWGWTIQEGLWFPRWTTLPEASKACQELIKCGC